MQWTETLCLGLTDCGSRIMHPLGDVHPICMYKAENKGESGDDSATNAESQMIGMALGATSLAREAIPLLLQGPEGWSACHCLGNSGQRTESQTQPRARHNQEPYRFPDHLFGPTCTCTLAEWDQCGQWRQAQQYWVHLRLHYYYMAPITYYVVCTRCLFLPTYAQRG